jgi:hypothetical protein
LVEENMGELPARVNIIERSQIKSRAIKILEANYGQNELTIGLVSNAINEAYDQIMLERQIVQ